MIAVIDYGAGNLTNVTKAFKSLGIESVVTDDPSVIKNASKIILPGVGSFGEAMQSLRNRGLDKIIKEETASGKPFLGICLGMQLLFEESEESPGVEGLGILKGRIQKIPPSPGLKIPHMGWNDIKCRGRLFEGLDSPYVYFVHSYCLDAKDKSIVSATADYGTVIESAVESGNIFAVQFHPEKSGDKGLKILSNFCETEALPCTPKE